MLPPHCRRSDNAARIGHYKRALRQALRRVTPVQREQLELYYARGLSKAEIAERQGKGRPAVTKSMQAAEHAMREYIRLYMEIHDQIERELRCDDR